MPAIGVNRNLSKPRSLPLLLFFITRFVFGQDASPGDSWQTWSTDVFARAAREHKFVLLNLEAAWCHWCSVMDRDTYGDDDVRKLIDSNYIAVKVEQSSRPDIASRYKDYDLPAAIIFQNDGAEIARTQGFRSPARMASLLQAVIDDPSPASSVTAEAAITYAATPSLAPDLLAELGGKFLTQYELADHGLSFATRYVDADFLDYAIELAQRGDDVEEERARAALRAMQSLLDPAFGGMYQSLVVAPGASGSAGRYARVQIGGSLDSEGDHWNEPHFEKLLSVQAQSIRMYARAYARWHTAQDLAAAENVHAYVRRFLASPEGAFYTSQAGDIPSIDDSLAYFAQDAAGRSRLGLPVVDKHQYTRENGWMIAALCALYAVTGDATTLHEAEESARWITQRRGRADGGFAHGEHDRGGPYLGDTLAAGEAFLALYEVTADRDWLQRAAQAARYIAENFPAERDVGFASSNSATDPAYKPHPDREENAHVARFANLLAYYTGCETDARIAARAMRYLASREVALAGLAAPVLLADAQFRRAPRQIIVVGARKDKKARALFRTALSTGPAYRQVEWFELTEEIMLPSGVPVARSDEVAAFVCSRTSCSPPISDSYVFTSLVANGQ